MILYIKYNFARKKEFQLTTTIEKENDKLFSYKKAATQDSLEFLNSLINKYDYLKTENLPFEILKPAATKKGVRFNYLPADSMDALFADAVRKKSKEHILKIITEYRNLLYKINLNDERLSNEFKKIFGGNSSTFKCLPIGCLDLNLDNIFITGGGYTLLDYEWTFFFPIPIKYILFRAVMYIYFKYSTYNISKIWDLKDALNFLDINAAEENLFLKFEHNFQNLVSKKKINYDEYKNGYTHIGNLAPASNVFDLYDAGNHKIAELGNFLKNKDNEIRKLNQAVARKDQEIRALTSDTWKISLNDLLKDKNDEIKKLNQAVEAGGQEINRMKASKFWKMKNVYVKARKVPSIIRNNLRQSDRINARMLSSNPIYNDWILKNEQLNTELIKEELKSFEYKPKISLLVPVYNVKAGWLDKCIGSVANQLYENWELCIHDDASTQNETLNCLKAWEAKNDPRIKISYGKQNQHISLASNDALKMAAGEFIALLDNDDELAPNALFENVKLLNRYPEADMTYSDEDKIGEDGARFDPSFKPDWSKDYFLSIMYTCHLGVYRKNIVDQIGGFRKGYEGSQDYDLVLRFIENSPNKIYHIPKILYHWRTLKTSAAGSSSAKSYAYVAAKQALSDYLERNQIDGSVEDGAAPGIYRVKRKILGSPRVTIIIPFRDLSSVLKRCVDSIKNKTSYKNYEIILVNNRSKEEETGRYLNSLKKNKKITIMNYNKVFNYSAINNAAAKKAGGEYLLFLNNDTEVIDEEWLSAMVEQIQREDVGIVGAKLLFPNDTIQHAGVIIGIGGIAGHIYLGYEKDSFGYLSNLVAIRNYNAVTAACMMVKKDVFFEVGGLDEKNLPIAFNDIDLCLKIRDKGYLVVFTPYARLYHYESLSRGSDDDFAVSNPKEHQRVLAEREYFKNKWTKFIDHDEYYNRNFSLGNDDKILPSQV